ncbi:0c797ad9-c365-496d-bbd1-4b6123ab741e [Thermothielavioides terrestris]|uniref:0c797ad9-c365-496d-bbd1-4b6123ab741e n=1 Tax=Thermothielavioides terrestris TaxID=2587410 RepID=A0A3S4CZM8_9PEZI|nr:0c797ad9-c365-496d-bbd1-4b6123ab741e [Thermothielavioides terrestris]
MTVEARRITTQIHAMWTKASDPCFRV